ncbi:class I SAM-dependent methyltransferase [Brevundimonas sp. Leaf168]|uniref:class I SAM-dependent methyltransferase n=1 Tax=Brevundimonas sp. Leaf168 TaxID=1736283 RepID=UPI001F20D77B|nr:class I SAM-dependent methyltransferase [Brevundimonas sp. Leaf168]
MDPTAARWGREGRHRTGDVCEADRLFSDLTFDAVVCNGVLGYGVDSPDQQQRALKALAAILRPGGRLLLGWNTTRSPIPSPPV